MNKENFNYILETHNLKCGYDTKNVLSCTDVFFNSGSITCLLGVNGSGKSTLLRTLSGLQKPQGGSVKIGDNTSSSKTLQDVHTLTVADRSSKISYVSQDIPNDVPFTVFDMVLMGRSAYLSFRSEPSEKDKEEANKAIQLLQLQKIASKPFEHLSGGQKRLVIIARSLASSSSVLLLDEPDSGLDIANRFLLWDAIHCCKEQGKTVLLSTHKCESVSELEAIPLFISCGEASIENQFTENKLSQIYNVHFEQFVSKNSEKAQFIPVYKKD